MTYGEATRIFLVVVTTCFTLIGLVAIRVMLRARDQAQKVSIVPVLLPTATLVLGVALTHVLLGGQLGGPERRGLWGEGTLIAFPTSLATVAGTFISLWAVFWTAEQTRRETQAQIAESRRHRVTTLIRLFDDLEEPSERIRREWFVEAAPQARWLESEIRKAWEELIHELKAAPSDLGSTECREGHTISLPEINVFLPNDEYGSSDILGCSHFRELSSKKLAGLYIRARQLAANMFGEMVPVRRIVEEIKPLLREAGFDTRKLLTDATFFDVIYPQALPEKATEEGRYALAKILAWVHFIHADEDWEFAYRARAAECGISVEKLQSDSLYLRKDWHLAQNASLARKELQSALHRLRDNDAILGSGSELDFWAQVAQEAGLSNT